VGQTRGVEVVEKGGSGRWEGRIGGGGWGGKRVEGAEETSFGGRCYLIRKKKGEKKRIIVVLSKSWGGRLGGRLRTLIGKKTDWVDITKLYFSSKKKQLESPERKMTFYVSSEIEEKKEGETLKKKGMAGGGLLKEDEPHMGRSTASNVTNRSKNHRNWMTLT